MLYQVALNIALNQTFSYQYECFNGSVNAKNLVGKLVIVSFGRVGKLNPTQTTIGLVLEKTSLKQIELIKQKKIKIKPILGVLTSTPVLNKLELIWLKQIAAYYHQPIGKVLFNALAKNYKNQKSLNHQRQQRKLGLFLYHAKPENKSNPSTRHNLKKLGIKQRELLEVFTSMVYLKRQAINEMELKQNCASFSKVRLKRLEELGFIKRQRIDFSKPIDQRKIKLTSDQVKIKNQIIPRLNQFTIELIYGDTGSGKTEIYLDLINQVLQSKKQVLFLVPEIGLIYQTKKRLEIATSLPVLNLHSGISSNQQFQTQENLKKGEFGILIGTRSAVFTSFNNLGLIVIDEEHDISYKQVDQLHYKANEAAYLRAKLLNIPVIIGSATPSLETMKLTKDKKIKLHRLIKKNNFNKKKIQIIAMDGEPKDRLLSLPLLNQIKKHLNNNTQCLLFLNRRGYAPLLKCNNCNWVQYCDDCDSTMVFHRFDNLMHCHHCQLKKAFSQICPVCGYKPLKLIGSGTEKLEQLLTLQFKNTPIWRIDRDRTQKKNAMIDLIQSIESTGSGLIIGTQMLSKGHDFSKVSLVGLLDMDQMLNNLDIQSQQRFAQLFIQVMGRTGRNDNHCEVLIQTRQKENELIKKLITRSYDGFLTGALIDSEKYQQPPFAYQAACKADSVDKKSLYLFLERWRQELKQFIFSQPIEIWQVEPTPIEKRSKRYHAYFLIYSKDRNTVHQALKLSSEKILPAMKKEKTLRYHLDINCNGIDF